MANCLRRRDQMVYSIFQNHAPWGTTHFFLSKWFHSERNCLLRRVHYQSNHQFFQDLRHSKIWKPFFFTFCCTEFVLFLDASTKFMIVKGTCTNLELSILDSYRNQTKKNIKLKIELKIIKSEIILKKIQQEQSILEIK